MAIPNGVYKIDLESSRALQVLKLAGWNENRSADITNCEAEYNKHGYFFNEYARTTLSEFYGLSAWWKFRWENKKHIVHIGGYDYTFESDAVYDHCSDEKSNLPSDIQSVAIPLFNVGFHQGPGIVWSSKDNFLIRTSMFSKKTERFNSVIELLESDLNSYIPSNEYVRNIFVTFDQQSLLHWDGHNRS